MPYLALNEFGDEVTAFQCRDEYIRDGIEYTEFSCPFCGVKYHASGIYKDGKIGKAPHFSLYARKPHIGVCDGEPLEVEPAKKAKKITGTVIKRDYDIPEKLVPKRVHKHLPTGGAPKAPPTDDEIREKRKKAGRTHGVALYTSSLLQTFVEARNLLVRECFKTATAKKLADSERNKLIQDTTASYPLYLFEKALNYNTAFWNANSIRHGDDERIFHAPRGVIHKTPTGFEIRSAPHEGATGKVTAVVRFDGQNDSLESLPRSHQRIFDVLSSAMKGGKPLKWYAYGKMQKAEGQDDAYILMLSSLDYLYLEG